MNTIKCPNCGQENKNTNIRCESCGTQLNKLEQNANVLNNDYSQKNEKIIVLDEKQSRRIINIILIILTVLWILFGLSFIGVGLYSSIKDNNKSKNYLETEGKLVSFENCRYDEKGSELCKGIYEYTIDGVTYKGSPNLLSNHSGFKQTAIVKYNPNNPSEYVMDSGRNGLLTAGVIIVTIVVIIFIAIKNFLKKIYKKSDETKKDNQVLKL